MTIAKLVLMLVVRCRKVACLRDFRTIRSVSEDESQYPERDHSFLLACSFYTHSISASITYYSNPPVYVIEFPGY